MFKRPFWQEFDKLSKLSNKYGDLQERRESIEQSVNGDSPADEIDKNAEWVEIDFEMEKIEKKIKKLVKKMTTLIN